MTPSRLWRKLTPDERVRISRAFWLDQEAVEDQVQAVTLIAQQKKLRPKTVIGLDPDRRARHLASILSLPDRLAARALVVYHLAEQRPMMGTFLDALGIAHEDGVIQADAVAPDRGAVGPAAVRLAAEYPPESVSLYLNTLFSQDPETWAALADVPQRSHE
jgi:hypothetical protein